jgi:hypothetical protein
MIFHCPQSGIFTTVFAENFGVFIKESFSCKEIMPQNTDSFLDK